VSKMANQVIMIDFDQMVLKTFSADNNNVGAETIETAMLGVLESKALDRSHRDVSLGVKTASSIWGSRLYHQPKDC